MTRLSKLRSFILAALLLAMFAAVCPVKATDSIPNDWTGMDIGGALPAGTASEKDGTFTVFGHGGGITPDADTFHFVFQPVSQDCLLIARVNNLSGTANGAFGGIMIRDSLSNNSNFAAVVVTPSQGASFEWRNVTAPGLASQNAPSSASPIWLKLTRRDNLVNGFIAPDVSGAPGTWQKLGGDEPIGSGMIFIGLCASSARPGNCTATIDNVSFTEGPVPELADGTYHLINVSAPAMAVDAHADASDGSQVHLAALGNAPSQLWVVKYKGNGNYQLSPSDHPALALSVDSKNAQTGTRIEVSASQNDGDTLWTIKSIGDGIYGLKSKGAPSFGIDNFGGNATTDAVIDVYPFNGADEHMQWAIVPVGSVYNPASVGGAQAATLDDGTYTLSPAHGPDMNLASTGGIAALAAQPIDAAQKWVFTSMGDGWFRAQPASDASLSLTVTPGPISLGTKLIVVADQGLPTQLWRVEAAGNGEVWLSPKCQPDYAIDDPGSAIVVGTPIQIWQLDRGNLNEQWIIKAATP